MKEYLIKESTLTEIANSVREKTNQQNSLELKEISKQIKGLALDKNSDICFYDYDGTLVYTYSFEDIKNMSELPPGPHHDRLIFQEWNWGLDALKKTTTPKTVGATYRTDTGATLLWIKILVDSNKTIPLHFRQTKTNTVIIDWGDGTTSQNISGTGDMHIEHTYSQLGEYIISIDTEDGSDYLLGNPSTSTGVFGVRWLDPNYPNATYVSPANATLYKVYYGNHVSTTSPRCYDYYPQLRLITLPDTLSSISGVSFFNNKLLKACVLPKNISIAPSGNFSGCNNLEMVSFPETLTTLAQSMFDYCYRLKYFHLPDTLTAIPPYIFKMCTGIEKINIPKGVTSMGHHCILGLRIEELKLPEGLVTVGDNVFQDLIVDKIELPDTVVSLGGGIFNGCYATDIKLSESLTALPASGFTHCRSLSRMIVPASVKKLHNDVFYNCANLKEVYFTKHTSVPSLGNTDAFYGVAPNCKIYVPKALESEWKAATNWSAYADQIIGV